MVINFLKSKNVLSSLFIGGLLLAVMGSGVKSSLTFADEDSLIKVNGESISNAEFADAKTKNPALDDEELLALMVDNRLLLQRARELGLLQSDRVIRKAIVQRVVEQEVKKALAQTVDEQSLLAFYHDNLTMFTPAEQFQVQIASFDRGYDQEKVQEEDQPNQQCVEAQTLKDNWSQHGDQTASVVTNWHKHLVNQPLADSPHSETLIYRQLGSRLAKQLTLLKAGEMSQPTPTEDGCVLMLLQQRIQGKALPFVDARAQVVAQYRVMSRRKALTDLLASLRAGSEIKIDQDIVKLLVAKQHTEISNE